MSLTLVNPDDITPSGSFVGIFMDDPERLDTHRQPCDADRDGEDEDVPSGAESGDRKCDEKKN